MGTLPYKTIRSDKSREPYRAEQDIMKSRANRTALLQEIFFSHSRKKYLKTIDKIRFIGYNISDESYPLAFVSVTDTCGDVRKGELPKLIVAPEEIKSRLWLFLELVG